jgi:Xaa-Pro aminopeptidase
MIRAIEFTRAAGVPRKRILPMDAGKVLSEAFPDSEIRDALFLLERLRAVKTTTELAKLRMASELVIEAMVEVIGSHGSGHTKQQISDALRVAEVKRGLTFEYCLIAAGASHNRAPSNQCWEQGDVLSLDSGATSIATSEISLVWLSWASPMPNFKKIWTKLSLYNVPLSQLSDRAGWVEIFTPLPRRF